MTKQARLCEKLTKEATQKIFKWNQEADALSNEILSLRSAIKLHPSLFGDLKEAIRTADDLDKKFLEITKEKEKLVQNLFSELNAVRSGFNAVKIIKKFNSSSVASWTDFTDFKEVMVEVSRVFKNSPTAGGYDIYVSFEDEYDEDIKFYSGAHDALEQLQDKLEKGTLVPILEVA